MHLSEVRDLKNSVGPDRIERLSALNIRHVEQLGSLLASPEGRYALQRLGFALDAVQATIEPALGKVGLSLSNPLKVGAGNKSLVTRERFPMGYTAGSRDPFREATFDSPLPEPLRPTAPTPPAPPGPDAVDERRRQPELILRPDDPFSARDQGRRGTCVAFAAMGMYQLGRLRDKLSPVAISPQYLYYRTRADDGFDPDEDVTSLEAALRVLKKHGCCLETHLPYVGRHDLRHTYRVRGHRPGRDEAHLREFARRYRIVDYRAIDHTVEAVKAELALGNPVGVGLAVYQLAWYNALARSRGEITLPPMDTSGVTPTILDTYLGGHAVTIVGYRDNEVEDDEESHRPGGGYFVFRNSWGEDWARGNDFAAGYGYLPYEYFWRFCLEAVVMEVVARSRVVTETEPDAGETVAPLPGEPKKSKPKKGARPKSKSTLDTRKPRRSRSRA